MAIYLLAVTIDWTGIDGYSPGNLLSSSSNYQRGNLFRLNSAIIGLAITRSPSPNVGLLDAVGN